MNEESRVEIVQAINSVLTGTSDRALHETEGAISTRRHIMTLVTQLESVLGNPNP